MKSIKYFFLVSLSFVTPSIFPQQVKVFSLSDGTPVENVAIFNKSNTISTLTNPDGEANLFKFSLHDTLIFQHPSFERKMMTKQGLKEQGYNLYLREKYIMIEEFVFSATRFREKRRSIPNKVDVIDAGELKSLTALTSPDILLHTGNVMVQKSQGGGGSPILRGFEANKILLVVDGVRMNNAIYRSGHLQNSLTIDNGFLERTEIIYGPTSVMYGSDALGGVVHYYTKDPELAVDKKFNFGLNAYTTYASANNTGTFHIDLNNGFKRVGFISSFTVSSYGDIRMGNTRSPFLGDFGKDFYYVEKVEGKDTLLPNPDPLVQRNTGYKQYDFVQKVKFSASKHLDITGNIQYSTSSEIDRYDQLSESPGENPKFAEWYYGPQNRLMTSVRSVFKNNNPFYTNFTSTLAFQHVEEDRISRKFKSKEKLFNLEEVDLYTANFDFLKIISRENRLNYGLEFSFNEVQSEAFYTNTTTGEQSPELTRYPDNGSYLLTYGAYASYKWFLSPGIILNSGARYSFTGLGSEFSQQFDMLPYQSVRFNNSAITGNASMVYKPSPAWQFNLIASTGFRSPNVDDYGKVRPKDNLITVPNVELEPEYSYNAEIGVARVFEGYLRFEGIAYMTWLTNAIARDFYSLSGRDSLFYQGENYKIITNTNIGEAMLRGFSFNLRSDFSRKMGILSTVNYTWGRDITNDEPLAHVPPVFGKTSLDYSRENFSGSFYIFYSGWKRMEDMSPFGEDNMEEATEYGFPGWFTLNLKTGYQIAENVHVQLAVENFLDTYYKVFASGISAPGRNLMVTVRANL